MRQLGRRVILLWMILKVGGGTGPSPGCLLSIQRPANAPEDSTSTRTLATHMGDQDTLDLKINASVSGNSHGEFEVQSSKTINFLAETKFKRTNVHNQVGWLS